MNYFGNLAAVQPAAQRIHGERLSAVAIEALSLTELSMSLDETERQRNPPGWEKWAGRLRPQATSVRHHLLLHVNGHDLCEPRSVSVRRIFTHVILPRGYGQMRG
jgi:hypothetical protein